MRRLILSITALAVIAGIAVTALPASNERMSAAGRLNFGRVETYGSTFASLTVKNTTGSTIHYWGQTGVGSPFTLTSNGCSSVATGTSCEMQFAFEPHTAQKYSQSITLYWQPDGYATWSWSTSTLLVGTGFVPKH